MFLNVSILERTFCFVQRQIQESGDKAFMQLAAGRAAVFPAPMVFVLGILLSTPLWISQVGLYQYLALEIMIWMMFALGYNLLLGFTGLPSFGHGAYFGIGAYAFGLLQLKVWPKLWFDLLRAVLVAASM